MDKDYSIIDHQNQVVDVVTYLACAIGMVSRWDKANPGLSFDYREATGLETATAHVIQTKSMKTYNFPD